VKGNFLAGRSFHDEADLADQCREWLRQVNTERPSDATGEPPAVLLAQEQPHFGPRPSQASDYGFFDCVVVSREGLVAIETNRYSVPAHLMGRALTARIHRSRIEVFADHELVATHVRLPAGQHARVIDPRHFADAFVGKPRGRAMVYRDGLCSLSPVVMSYVHEVSHKRRKELNQQMVALYDLAQEIGLADFVGSAGTDSGTADVRGRICACDCEPAVRACVQPVSTSRLRPAHVGCPSTRGSGARSG
jgi:hypothetical protein